jgi:hypothetical protein
MSVLCAAVAVLSAGPAPPGQLVEDSLLYSDSVYRHFYYAVPEECASGQRLPLLVWLHGGVSAPEAPEYEPEALQELHPIPELMARGFAVALPCGQEGATWWDPVGQQGILDIVAEMKRRLPIDASRVIVGGFSDGASGAMALAMLSPSPFAGYMAFSGHPGVGAIDGGRATYLASLANRPGMVTHTDLDGLYPSSAMSGAVELAREAGASIDYYTLDGYGHEPDYLPELEEEILAFADTVRRHRFPAAVVWKAGEPSGCDWLRVDSVVPWPILTTDAEHNMVMVSERISIGFIPDWEATGGIRVESVPEGDSPAVRAGLLSGDTIVAFDGVAMDSLADLSGHKAAMSPGDPFTMEVIRNGDRLTLEGELNPPQRYWLLPRTGPAVEIRAERDGNHIALETNRLCRITLLLHREMVDLQRPVRVSCNGLEVFRGPVEESPALADSILAATADSLRGYSAALRLDLEERMKPLLAGD